MDKTQLIAIISTAAIAAFAKEIFSFVLTFSKNQINARLAPIVKPIPMSLWVNLLIAVLNFAFVIFYLYKLVVSAEPLTRPDMFLISFYTVLSFFWTHQSISWTEKIHLARRRHQQALAEVAEVKALEKK